MRRLGVAFGVALAGSILLYLLADLWLHIGEEPAKAVAGIPLLFCTQIFEAIDRSRLKNDLAKGTVSTREFGIRPVWAIVLALVTTVALIEIVTDYMAFYFDIAKFGIERFTFDYTPGDSTDNWALVSCGAAVPLFIGIYLIGRWLGTRSTAGVITTVGCMTLAVALGKAFAVYLAYSGALGYVPDTEPPPWPIFVGANVAGLLLFGGIAALGFWRGRKRRAGAYLSYLPSGLPDSERAALVGLAEDEVFKTRASLVS
jgi:energy-converting hydrogenase Eha subunit H